MVNPALVRIVIVLLSMWNMKFCCAAVRDVQQQV